MAELSEFAVSRTLIIAPTMRHQILILISPYLIIIISVIGYFFPRVVNRLRSVYHRVIVHFNKMPVTATYTASFHTFLNGREKEEEKKG